MAVVHAARLPAAALPFSLPSTPAGMSTNPSPAPGSEGYRAAPGSSAPWVTGAAIPQEQYHDDMGFMADDLDLMPGDDHSTVMADDLPDAGAGNCSLPQHQRPGTGCCDAVTPC
jgi:hypothetical protein